MLDYYKKIEEEKYIYFILKSIWYFDNVFLAGLKHINTLIPLRKTCYAFARVTKMIIEWSYVHTTVVEWFQPQYAY